jgi:hypothetical protein
MKGMSRLTWYDLLIGKNSEIAKCILGEWRTKSQINSMLQGIKCRKFKKIFYGILPMECPYCRSICERRPIIKRSGHIKVELKKMKDSGFVESKIETGRYTRMIYRLKIEPFFDYQKTKQEDAFSPQEEKFIKFYFLMPNLTKLFYYEDKKIGKLDKEKTFYDEIKANLFELMLFLGKLEKIFDYLSKKYGIVSLIENSNVDEFLSKIEIIMKDMQHEGFSHEMRNMKKEEIIKSILAGYLVAKIPGFMEKIASFVPPPYDKFIQLPQVIKGRVVFEYYPYGQNLSYIRKIKLIQTNKRCRENKDSLPQ